MVAVKSNSILKYRKASKRSYQYSINRVEVKRNRRSYSETEAQRRASYLADKFRNPEGIRFYLKCAWNLTDNYIDWLVEYSMKKSNPARYFVSVASKKMAE